MVGLTGLGCHLPRSLVLLPCSLVLAFHLSQLLNGRCFGSVRCGFLAVACVCSLRSVSVRIFSGAAHRRWCLHRSNLCVLVQTWACSLPLFAFWHGSVQSLVSGWLCSAPVLPSTNQCSSRNPGIHSTKSRSRAVHVNWIFSSSCFC